MKKIRILFQGDSITDAGRNRRFLHGLTGYTKKTARKLVLKEGLGFFKYDFYNRGISGDRTWDLLKRYKKDFVDLKPDVVTIMIGINDVWRKYDNNDPTTPEQYEENLIKLLTDLKRDTGAKIILLSPYLTPDPHGKHDEMRSDVDIFIEKAEAVAKKYADAFINTDVPMNKGAGEFSARAISGDGVHPAAKGQSILSDVLSAKIAEMTR